MESLAVAQRYLDALISHDAESVPLATGARRTNNGCLAVEGVEAMRAVIRREPVAAMHDLRWLVSGEHAVVFYDLEADLGRGEGPVTARPEDWMPASIGERFRVRGGMIEEIEVVYATAAPGTPRPERPALYPAGEADREVVLAASRAYVAALLSHDATSVPLADKAWRVENGRDTGRSGPAIRASLESDVMSSIESITEESWFATEDSAAAFYTLTVNREGASVSLRVAERFRAVDGQLVEVEAVVGPPIKSA